jgi:AcrR family transcriptional regulator
MIDSTKDRILDAAELRFAESGYAATSIRQIVADAHANLAAVNYHFKSKEALLDAVVHRRARPVNEDRIARLDRFEAEAAGAPLAVEKILEAFLMPVIALTTRHPVMVKLISRIHAEGVMARLMRTEFQPVVARFLAALRKSLPCVPPEELFWRISFMMGAMVGALNGPDLPALQGQAGAAARLVAFLAAGFRAPATSLEEEENR